LHEYIIQPLQQYDSTKVKNTSNSVLVINLMDVMYTKQINAICYLSADCGIALMMFRIVAGGKDVS